jgi:hypothetical protein
LLYIVVNSRRSRRIVKLLGVEYNQAMTKAQRPYVEMVKDGTYQVKVPLAGHALPHVLPGEFPSKEEGESWLQSPTGRELVKLVRDKYAPQQSK